MLCAICGQREATLFIRRTRGNLSEDLSLCEACARKRGLFAGPGRLELRLDELIASPEAEPRREPGGCPRCGLGLDELLHGRLGCADCAATFRTELGRLLRLRAHPPFYRDDPADIEVVRRLAPRPAANDARADMGKAATRHTTGAAESAPPQAGFGDCAPFVLSDAGGSDRDVVLWSAARVPRCLADLPFPGRRDSPPSRELVTGIVATLPRWRVFPLADCPEAERRAFVESGYLSRSFALDPEARVACSGEGAYCIFDEDAHFSVRMRTSGLDLSGAAGRALTAAGELERAFAAEGHAPAFDGEFGYLLPKIGDMGTGLCLSVCIHVPALAVAGLTERAFRSLLAAGYAVSGFYGGEGGSAGDLYCIATERSYGVSRAELDAAFMEALTPLLAAERISRARLAAERRDDLLDLAGRALGILRYCRRLSAVEAAAHLSALRLAVLAGLAEGVEEGALAKLLGMLGSSSLSLAAKASGEKDPGGDAVAEERVRARLVARAVAGLQLR